MSGDKHDQGKIRMDLLDPEVMKLMAKVLTFGADKYGDHNWRKGIKHSRLYSAVQRHLHAYWGGENFDIESGIEHLAHAMCGIMMMLAMPSKDDRYVKDLFADGVWTPSKVQPMVGETIRPTITYNNCEGYENSEKL